MGSTTATVGRRIAGSLHVARELLATRRLADVDLGTVRRAQERRIAGMIAHAAATVPYYRDTLRALGLSPDRVRTAADLARLPIVERRQVQEDPQRFLSNARPRTEYLELRTGGSSGAPLSVHHDPLSVLENTAHGERHRATLRRLTGRRRFRTLLVGSPRGAEVELRAFASRFALLPRAAAGETTHFTMAERPEDVARAIAGRRPDVVLGYGSYLERIAQILEEEHPQGVAPRVFAYGGDAMSPAARERIVNRLGARAWSSYQAVECLKIAFECARGAGLHVHADLCALRVVDRDGNDVAPGGRGEVTLLEGACGCGSPLPLVSFPDGRVEDWFPLPSGERVYTQRLRALFTDERDVWRYQVVQERPSALRIALVAAEGADRAAIASRIGAAIARVVGRGVAISVDYVDDVERTADGKVRAVVRRG